MDVPKSKEVKMLLTHTVENHEANQKISQLLKNKFNISSRLLTKLKMNQRNGKVSLTLELEELM